jgi:hypothetical protein
MFECHGSDALTAFAARKNEGHAAFIFSRLLARYAGEPEGLKGDQRPPLSLNSPEIRPKHYTESLNGTIERLSMNISSVFFTGRSSITMLFKLRS